MIQVDPVLIEKTYNIITRDLIPADWTRWPGYYGRIRQEVEAILTPHGYEFLGVGRDNFVLAQNPREV